MNICIPVGLIILFVLVLVLLAAIASRAGLGDMVDNGDGWPDVQYSSSRKRDMRKRPK